MSARRLPKEGLQFTFTITTDTENLNNTERNEEDGDPNTDIEIWTPEADSETGGGKLEWQYGQP